MSIFLLDQLNVEQKKAVLKTEGPILILAGAGSGKTRVLTYKTAYLILEKKINPNQILMVTFTNKAAQEMKERIKKLIGSTNLPPTGTFHSFCSKILRQEGKHIGIPPSFTIYDEKDQNEAIKEAVKHLQIEEGFTPSSFASAISQAKNELITNISYLEYARGYFQEKVAKIYLYYQNLLKKNNALDFDDLLLETFKLLTTKPEVAAKYQNQFRYLLIDEYQDTNKAQYEISKILAAQHQNICVVGDASQSIYSWRGANYRNITDFIKDFPKTSIFHLEENYRSTQKILDAASQIISHNILHPILKLQTKNSRGDNLLLYEATNEQDEALFIIKIINQLLKENQQNSLKNFAVLFRTNAQSRILEEVFLHHGLPYLLIGNVRFYERKEIQDILAYLKFLYNPQDKIAYQRIEKIGKKRLNKYLLWLEEIKKKGVKQFTTLEILDQIIQKTNYLDLFAHKNEENLAKLENLKELRSVAAQFPNLTTFLENVALIQHEYLPVNKSSFDKTANNAVHLSTIHAAKGLEFTYVFLIGMEEGLFPHSQSLLDKEALEEERRLCYVAITRAKKRVFLTYTRKRFYFGKYQSNLPSRFIAEIPQDLLIFKTAGHFLS